MNCKKCGALLSAETKFCSVCGTPVSGSDDFFGNSSASSPSYTPQPPKKSNKKIVFSIIAAVLAVFIAVGIFAGSAIMNSVSRMFTSPDEYLLQVEEKNTEYLAKNLTNYINNVKSTVNLQNGINGEINITFGNELKNMIVSSADPQAAPYINWINSAGLKFDFVNDNNSFGCGIGLKVNEKDALTANTVMDFTDEAMYLSLPEINPTAIRVPLNDINLPPQANNEIINAFNKISQIVPDDKVLSDIICRYMHAVALQIKNVTESEDTITVGNITRKSTLLTATIDEKTAIDISIAVLTEFKNDQEIKNIISEFAQIAGESQSEIIAELETATNEALTNLENSKANLTSTETIIVKVWVDNDGMIEGIGFEADGVNLVFQSIADKNNYANKFEAQLPAANVNITGTGTEKGGKYNSKYAVAVNGTDIVNITCENIDKDLYEDGVINGKIIIEPSKQLSDVLAMIDPGSTEAASIAEEIRLEIDSRAQSLDSADSTITVYYQNNMFVALQCKTSLSSSYKISKPATYVDANSADQWAQTLDISSIVNILKNIGAPSEITDALSMVAMMNSQPQIQ